MCPLGWPAAFSASNSGRIARRTSTRRPPDASDPARPRSRSPGLYRKKSDRRGTGTGGDDAGQRERVLAAAEQHQRRPAPGRPALARRQPGPPALAGPRDDEESRRGVVDLVAVEELPHRPWPERLPPVQFGGIRRRERDLDDRAAQRLPIGERLDDGQGADHPLRRGRDHALCLVRLQPGELDNRPEAQRPRGEREFQPHPGRARDRTGVLDAEHRVLPAQPRAGRPARPAPWSRPARPAGSRTCARPGCRHRVQGDTRRDPRVE